jgi:integrase
MERKEIGLRDVRTLAPNTELWDSKVAGFGARRQRSKAVAYVLLYRTPEGRQRRLTIGRHGAPWTPDTARTEAKRLLGLVAGGQDPEADKQAKREAKTVAELCDLYMADAEAGRLLTRMKRVKTVKTLLSDKSRIEGHIKPKLGKLAVASVTTQDVEAFMHAVAEGETVRRVKTDKKRGLSNVRGGMGTASRAVGLLGGIFTYAIRKRLRPDNPVRGVVRPADGQRERRLSDDEYKALGTALKRAVETTVTAKGVEKTTVWPAAVAAVRFLALTGWRSGEALTLRWENVDLGRRTATLPATKTGKSMRPLSHTACDVLAKLDRTGDLVFPATRGNGIMTGFRKLWNRIIKLGELPADVTPHVLRHSFASLAADLEYSEITIAALVGHKGATVTRRYIHSADAVLLAAADAVATETGRRMGEIKPTAKVVELRHTGVG